MSEIDNTNIVNREQHVIHVHVHPHHQPYDYRSTWGNELEMDYAVEVDFSDSICERLQQNDRKLSVMRFPRWWTGNDTDFIRLGQALTSNTSLKSLRLENLHGPFLTSTGMEALANGICQSRIEYLMLDGMCPPDIQRSLYQGIWQSTTIRFISIVMKHINVHALRDIVSPLSMTIRKSGPDLPFHLRDFNLRDCAAFDTEQMRLLSSGVGVNRSIKSFALYNCSLTDDALEIFCQHWNVDSPIEEIDLRDNFITPRGAQLMVKAAGQHPKMKRVAFSGNRTMGYEGLKVVAQEIGNTHLDGTCCCSVIPLLDATPMSVRDEAFREFEQALRRNQGLHFLILRDVGMGPLGAQAIMRGVAGHAVFSDLGINKNEDIGYVGLRLIGEELPNARFDDINVESCVSNEIKASVDSIVTRAQACQALANGLRHNTYIKELKLGSNGIDAKGVQLLLSGLIDHPSMTKLSLVNNPNIGYEGLEYIGQALPNLRLEGLDLADCCTSIDDNNNNDNDVDVENNEMARRAGQALVNGIKDNVHLQQLYLNETDLADDFRDDLDFYLELNRSGRKLMQSNPSVAPMVWCYIFEHLEDDISHIFYFIKEQPWLITPPSSGQSSTSSSRKRKVGDDDDDNNDDVL